MRFDDSKKKRRKRNIWTACDLSANLPFHTRWRVSNAKRRYEHIDDCYQKYAENRKIINSISLAYVVVLFHIVSTVHNQSNTNGNLFYRMQN